MISVKQCLFLDSDFSLGIFKEILYHVSITGVFCCHSWKRPVGYNLLLINITGTIRRKRSVRIRLHICWQYTFVSLAFGLHVPQVLAQCADDELLQQQKLSASIPTVGGLFGKSVSVSGTTAVVGAFTDNCTDGPFCGIVYVFRFDGTTWLLEQELTHPETGGASSTFGISVSVSKDIIMVGGGADGCFAGTGLPCGSVDVFHFNGSSWQAAEKLTASDTQRGDQFGRSVSLSGNTVVVGARGDSCASGSRCGSAYLFRYNGTSWIEEQKLTASDAEAEDEFGHSVSISGETTLVSTRFKSCEHGPRCGAAYVYSFDGDSWNETQKLSAFDNRTAKLFGSSVSISGNTAFVGAILDHCSAGLECGSVYVYRFNGTSWVDEQKLIPFDAVAKQRFGVSLSISGNMAVVGSYFDECREGKACGSAYVYHYNGILWEVFQKLTASDASAGDQFGMAVSAADKKVIVGSVTDDCMEDDSCGSAYVFSCETKPTVANLHITSGGCPNPVNPRSEGVVSVTLVGDTDFDITMVDPDSLTLNRTDGAGTTISPLVNKRGPRIDIKDIALSSGGEPCTCHDRGRDGFDDLSLLFSTAEMSRAFNLDSFQRGESIELMLRGVLQDGTTFEAVDCFNIPGPESSLNQCEEQMKLTSSIPSADTFFGNSVSVSGRNAIVGAWGDDCDAGVNCGAVYAYHYNHSGWVEVQKLTASDATTGAVFGLSVSVDGDTALVGARSDSCADGTQCGSAYVYRYDRTEWIEEQKLIATDLARADWFGFSVSLNGNTALIGSPFDDDCESRLASNCGSAYIYRFNGTNWVEEQKLIASDPGLADFFGATVSISGDTAVVGALGNNCVAGVNCGAAYVFRFNGIAWIEEQKLIASDAKSQDRFGGSVSTSGNAIIVGSSSTDCALGKDCGAAYVFRFIDSSWDQEQKLTASDAAIESAFGSAVSLSGNTIIVGADDDYCEAGRKCGSSYIFRFDGSSWLEDQKLTASDSKVLDGFGVSVSLDRNTAVVGASNTECLEGNSCGSVYTFNCGPTHSTSIQRNTHEILPGNRGLGRDAGKR